MFARTQRDITPESLRPLVTAIVHFLETEIQNRTDWENRDKVRIRTVINCLESVYRTNTNNNAQTRIVRPLMDIYREFLQPVSVQDRIRAEAHKNAGDEYMRQGMFSHADVEYSIAIGFHPWDSIYYCNRASARIEQRNFAGAKSDCNAALGLSPDYAKAHGKMGKAYLIVHNPAPAVNCFRHALQLEPGNESYAKDLEEAENQVDIVENVWFIKNLQNIPFRKKPPKVHVSCRARYTSNAKRTGIVAVPQKRETKIANISNHNSKAQHENAPNAENSNETERPKNRLRKEKCSQNFIPQLVLVQGNISQRDEDLEKLNNPSKFVISKPPTIACTQDCATNDTDDSASKQTPRLKLAEENKNPEIAVVRKNSAEIIPHKRKTNIAQSRGWSTPGTSKQTTQSKGVPNENLRTEIYNEKQIFNLNLSDVEPTAYPVSNEVEIANCSKARTDSVSKGKGTYKNNQAKARKGRRAKKKDSADKSQ